MFFGGVLVVLASLFAFIQYADANNGVFLYLNQTTRPFGDTFWECVTVLGDGLIGCLLVAPFIQRRPRIVLSTLAAGLIVLGIVQAVKYFLGGLPRPVLIIPADQMHYFGPYVAMNAFPSGHSATAFMLAGVLGLTFRSWGLRVLFVILASIVALSRVAVGAHWPVDILGGAFLGWSAAGVGYLIAQHSKYSDIKATRLIFALALLAAAVSIFFYDVTRYPGAYWLLRTMAVVAIVVLVRTIWLEFHTSEKSGEEPSAGEAPTP